VSRCCGTAAAACTRGAFCATKASRVRHAAQHEVTLLPGCIERLNEVVTRTHTSNLACCIAAIRTLVHIADHSSIGIREIFMTSGCVAMLLEVKHYAYHVVLYELKFLQLLTNYPDSEMTEHCVLVFYHLSSGLLQVPRMLTCEKEHLTLHSSTRFCAASTLFRCLWTASIAHTTPMLSCSVAKH
jgi:hypothetical protein